MQALIVDSDREGKPVLLSYCGTFLKPEALHTYRQVTATTGFDNWVVARHRANEASFTYEHVMKLRRSPFHPVRRFLRRWCPRVVLDGIEMARPQRIVDARRPKIVNM